MVWLRLRDGREFVGRYVERKERFVVLSCGTFTTKEIAAMGYRRHDMPIKTFVDDVSLK